MFRTIITAAATVATIAVSMNPATAGNAVETFATPMIDGQEIDVRFTRNHRANPSYVADAFCSTQGYRQAVHFTTQAFKTTRGFGDHQLISTRFGHHPEGFTSITCQTPEVPSTIKAKHFTHVSFDATNRADRTGFEFDPAKGANNFCIAQGFRQAKDFHFDGLAQNTGHGISTAEYKPIAVYNSISCETPNIVTLGT